MRYTVPLAFVLGAAACGGKIDAGATGSESSRAVGDGAETPAVTPPAPGLKPSCSLASPIRADFEAGNLPDSWSAANATALKLDRDVPVAGAQSLRFDVGGPFPVYVAINLPKPSCAVSMTFTVRADPMLVDGEPVTLAKLNAGTGTFFHLRLEGGRVSLNTERRSSAAAQMMTGRAAGDLAAGTPAVIRLVVDVGAGAATLAVAPVGTPLPGGTSVPIGAASPEEPIRSIQIGAVPGFSGRPAGKWWLDDLVIE